MLYWFCKEVRRTNTRIKKIRKDEGLTQEEFGKRINMSRNFIAQVESGTKEFSKRTLADICREFNIREEWIISGEGEMKLPKSRNDEIAEIVHAALAKDPEEERKSLIAHIEKLSDAEILLLAELLERKYP